jgi:hypothetical protein
MYSTDPNQPTTHNLQLTTHNIQSAADLARVSKNSIRLIPYRDRLQKLMN